jgi:hypothetical protein
MLTYKKKEKQSMSDNPKRKKASILPEINRKQAP